MPHDLARHPEELLPEGRKRPGVAGGRKIPPDIPRLSGADIAPGEPGGIPGDRRRAFPREKGERPPSPLRDPGHEKPDGRGDSRLPGQVLLPADEKDLGLCRSREKAIRSRLSYRAHCAAACRAVSRLPTSVTSVRHDFCPDVIAFGRRRTAHPTALFTGEDCPCNDAAVPLAGKRSFGVWGRSGLARTSSGRDGNPALPSPRGSGRPGGKEGFPRRTRGRESRCRRGSL